MAYISTAYPARGNEPRNQRTPVKYISGTAANNDGGVVLSKGSTSGNRSVVSGHITKKGSHEQIVNSPELGCKAADSNDAFPGSNTQIFKKDVDNVPCASVLKFVRDVSQSYNKGGSWDYVTRQKAYVDVTLTGSELVTNGDFATNTTGWTLSGAARTTNYGGEIKLDALIGTMSPDTPIVVTAGSRYRLAFEIKALTQGPERGICLVPSLGNPTFINIVGTHYFDFDIPVGTTTFTFSIGNEADEAPTSEAYIDNISLKKILVSEINTTFGAEATPAVYFGGSNGPTNRRTFS